MPATVWPTGVIPPCQRQAARHAPTVAELATQYLDLYAKVQKKSWREDARYLTSDVLPAWGQRQAADVRRRDVVVLLDQIVARGAPIAANRVLALVGSSPYRGYSYGRCLPRCLVLSASIMF